MTKLTHVDENNRPRMVDVSHKAVTRRSATAQSVVSLPPAVRAVLNNGELVTKKGPVFQTAIIAGVMAAKQTHHLIPFCHPLGIEKCDIDIAIDENGNARIECTVTVTHKTGVEMEALTGASVAALTIYDMCKALSQDMVIGDTRLLRKTGGKSDIDNRPNPVEPA